MSNIFWTALACLMLGVVIAVFIAALNGELPNQKRAAACQKLGGAYLYREGVCLRQGLVQELP